MSTAIRIAGLQDLESVVPLFDLYRQFYGRMSDEALAHAFLQERLVRKESVIFLAEAEGAPSDLHSFIQASHRSRPRESGF